MSVSVRAPFEPVSVIAAVLVNVIAPEPDASSDPLLVPSVNCRSVDPLVPVYCNAPPLITRLAAAVPDLPMPLATPPLASVVTLSTPLLIVVAPLYVLILLRLSVPPPVFVRELAPESVPPRKMSPEEA